MEDFDLGQEELGVAHMQAGFQQPGNTTAMDRTISGLGQRGTSVPLAPLEAMLRASLSRAELSSSETPSLPKKESQEHRQTPGRLSTLGG